MRPMRLLQSFAFALASMVVLACTSTSGGPVTQPGSSVYTPDVDVVVLDDLGGGLTPPPPAGQCNTSKATFTLTVAPRTLAWSMCNGTTTVTGSRALTTDELTALETKLDALVVVTGTSCGADKPEVALTVKTSDKTQAYGDSFYACNIHDRPLIDTDALSNAETALRTLAGK